MRFFKKFSRFKGVVPPGEIALGADAAPTTELPNVAEMSNLLVSQVTSMNAGWPIHRIAVIYHGPALAVDIPATMMFYEELTGRWYGVGGTVDLKPDKVVFFDTVGLLDRAPVGPDAIEPKSGNLACVLLATNPGGAPNGEHIFALAPDLTTFSL